VVSDILTQARTKMEKSVQTLRHDLGAVRAGRANPALLEKLRVDYYGAPTPVQKLASITTPDARTIVIQPWDKGAVGAIEKAILKSDLGLVPQTEGGVIRLNLPQLTAERRGELVRHVRKLAEDQRVAVRNIRREAREQLERQEKAGEISSDELKRASEELQKMTDRAMAEIGQILEAKEREIMEV
jgi:ribosome recycling factor